MKHKASLLLMEQLVMILVFAAAAGVCLQLFAAADRISVETARRDRAVVLARNAAELLKATEGDQEAAEALGADGYRIAVTSRTSSVPGLAAAGIDVYYEETLQFSLETGWQEVLP